MDDEEENTKKNSSDRKQISYSTEFRLDINLNNLEGRGEKGRGLKCYIHTYIQTDIQTEPLMKRVLEEHSLLKTNIHFFGRSFLIDK